MDHKSLADEYLSKKEYSKYSYHLEKQYEQTKLKEDHDKYEKSKKMLDAYKDIQKIRMIDRNDYYKILDVKRDASDAIIKSSYHRMVKKYHPDITGLEESNEVFMIIRTAYTNLSDTTKRRQYDDQRIYGSRRVFDNSSDFFNARNQRDFAGFNFVRNRNVMNDGNFEWRFFEDEITRRNRYGRRRSRNDIELSGERVLVMLVLIFFLFYIL